MLLFILILFYACYCYLYHISAHIPFFSHISSDKKYVETFEFDTCNLIYSLIKYYIIPPAEPRATKLFCLSITKHLILLPMLLIQPKSSCWMLTFLFWAYESVWYETTILMSCPCARIRRLEKEGRECWLIWRMLILFLPSGTSSYSVSPNSNIIANLKWSYLPADTQSFTRRNHGKKLK